MIVAVGSQNKTKIDATKKAFIRIFNLKSKEIKIISIRVQTKIKQPTGEKLTIKLAKNRAKIAQKTCKNADFWIGIEGGLIKKNTEIFAQTWVAALNKENNISIAGGPMLPFPQVFSNNKITLSQIIQKIEKFYKFKSKGGTSGRLTNGLITRKDDIIISITCALSKFEHYKLFS